MAFLLLLFLGSIYLSCTKAKTTPLVLPTAADTISKIIDSIKGKYRVFVVKDSNFYIVDSLGFDTIEVLKAGTDSISLLNYTMTFCENQILRGSWFFFLSNQDIAFPPTSQTASFFLLKDSLEFITGYGGFEWGTYLIYRGKKISQ